MESLSEYRLRRRKSTGIRGSDSTTNISNRRVDSSSRDIRNSRGAKSSVSNSRGADSKLLEP
jgi:hypothetical protein